MALPLAIAVVKRIMPIRTRAEYNHYAKSTNKVYNSPEEEWDGRLSVDTKSCSKCGEEKGLYEYAGNTSGSDGFDKEGLRRLRPECNYCNKEAAKGKANAMRLAKKLGLALSPPEGSKCELCRTKYANVFDHDHVTHEFRGFLCDDCNRGLGLLGDSIEGLNRALAYVSKSGH